MGMMVLFGLRPGCLSCNTQCLSVQVAGLTCSQLTTVLQLLGVQGQVRCGVIVALWSKLLDRHNLVKVGSRADQHWSKPTNHLHCSNPPARASLMQQLLQTGRKTVKLPAFLTEYNSTFSHYHMAKNEVPARKSVPMHHRQDQLVLQLAAVGSWQL